MDVEAAIGKRQNKCDPRINLKPITWRLSMKSFLKTIKAILTDSRKVSLTVWALERERSSSR